jgi:predicted thioesterase
MATCGMINPFQIGDERSFSHVVIDADIAQFNSGTVHPVYSTFALARDAEWSGRLFVLEMKEEGEEGIGTGISIEHSSPALLGSVVVFVARLIAVNRNEVVTSFEARVGERLIAKGEQKQKILLKTKLEMLFNSLS